MPHADFVHLRVHSAYSLSEGALKTKDLVKLCVQGGMPAVAVTDTGNLFGALEFASEAAPSGVQPIVGCLFGITRTGGRAATGVPQSPDRMVLLVQDEAGYANLLKLVSRAFMDSDGTSEAQLTLTDLAGSTDGLIALVGAPDSPIGRLLVDGQKEAAGHCLDLLQDLFPGRLYIELQRHGLSTEQAIEPDLLELADATGLPLVATNDAFFADRAMYEAHDALICIAEGVTVSTEQRRRLTPEHGFKSASEMRELFADLPEAMRQHAGDRPALRLHAGEAQADPAALRQRQRPGGAGGAAGAVPSRARRAPGADRRTGRTLPPIASGWTSSWTSSCDGLPRLLPDRRRLHQVGQGARAFRSGRAAARAPARSSPGR
jgi:DNA polymerase III alpha subunit